MITEAQRSARAANATLARAAYLASRQAVAAARLAAGAKQCTRCRRSLPLPSFDRDSRAADGRQPACIPCTRAAARARAAAAAEAVALAAAARTARIVCRRCGGPLVWDTARLFWRVLHLAGCRWREWQPSPPDPGAAPQPARCQRCGGYISSRRVSDYCSRECEESAQRRQAVS